MGDDEARDSVEVEPAGAGVAGGGVRKLVLVDVVLIVEAAVDVGRATVGNERHQNAEHSG